MFAKQDVQAQGTGGEREPDAPATGVPLQALLRAQDAVGNHSGRALSAAARHVDPKLRPALGRALAARKRVLAREPTRPRATTGDRLIREAESVLTLAPDPASSDPTLRMWSRVSSNFSGALTAGRMARQVWTHVFARHFTEPDSPPGTESVHPRYFYSRRYGWIDGQHFFGYIDFAEGKVAAAGNRATGFEDATRHGIRLEHAQMLIRHIWDALRGPPPGGTDVERLLQVRPPNTPLFQVPGMVGNAITYNLSELLDMTASEVASRPELAGIFAGNPMWELFRQLDRSQRGKFWLDNAKSAWSYEDIRSNQLGIQFWFRHGETINALPDDASKALAFRTALADFFHEIEVVNDEAELQQRALALPPKERWDRPETDEATERRQHPDLFTPFPAPAVSSRP